MNTHIPDTTLQEYADRALSPEVMHSIREHCHQCDYCAQRVRAVTSLGRGMKRIPLEKPSQNFTDRVMESLGIQESPSLIWKFVSFISPIILVVITLAVSATAYFTLSSWKGTGNSDSATSITQTFDTAKKALTTSTHEVNLWLTKLFPFHFSNDGLYLTVFLICFLTAIGLLDRYLFPHFLKKQ